VLLAFALPRSAAAQTGDPAAASELFRQGRAALAEQDFAAACPKFAESQRLDPKVGTLINLALCEEKTGRLASALHHWADALVLARSEGDAREAYVTQQYDALAPRVGHVVLHRAPGVPDDARVLVDGVETAPGDRGAPLPVDAGPHVIVVRAPNHADARFEATVSEGATAVVALEAGPDLSPPPAPPVAAPAATAATAVPARDRATAQRWVGYGVGALGIVGLGLGAAWGGQALEAKSEPGCRSGVCTTEAAAQVQRDGHAAGDRSTIAFVAGSALMAGGITLWLLAPRAGARPTASIALTMHDRVSALLLGGAW
jgi:hypothetical protein